MKLCQLGQCRCMLGLLSEVKCSNHLTSLWYQNQTKKNHKTEKYRPISLMNINIIVIKYKQTEFNIIKRIIHHNQLKFISEKKMLQYLQSRLNSISTNWRINIIWSSQLTQKKLWQNSTFIYDKNLQLRKLDMKYINIIKAIYDKPTTDITINGEKLKAFL